MAAIPHKFNTAFNGLKRRIYVRHANCNLDMDFRGINGPGCDAPDEHVSQTVSKSRAA
jgi:hypothetical protein